jgi:hypothetical protein
MAGKPFVLPDNAATMPTGEPERLIEAVRRSLPELLKLARYERVAAGRRDKATRSMIARKSVLRQSAVLELQKEANLVSFFQ